MAPLKQGDIARQISENIGGNIDLLKKKDDCFVSLNIHLPPKYTKHNHLSTLTVILSYSGDVIVYAIRPVVSAGMVY